MKTIVSGDQNDNTVWVDQGLALGLGGDDNLSGTGAATLVGGAGNDALHGSFNGASTYVFGRGDGHDTILSYTHNVTRFNVLQLVGVTPADIAASRDGDSLLLTITDSGDSIRIEHYFKSAVDMAGYLLRPYHVESIRFDQGQTWDHAAVMERMTPSVALTEDKDEASGPSLRGLGGDDRLSGTGGDDLLVGGSGYDMIDGGLGNDFLEGGSGSDVLWAGGGLDTMRFERGWGNDTVQGVPAWNPMIGWEHAISLEMKGILADELAYSREGDTLVIALKGSSDTIRVPSYFLDPYSAGVRVSLRFDDGSEVVPDIAPYVDPSRIPGQQIVGGPGDDLLAGGGGNDTFLPGAGNAEIDGGGGKDLVAVGRAAGLVQLAAHPGGSYTVVLDADVLPSQVSVSLDPLGYLVSIDGSAARVLAPRYEAEGVLRTDVRFQFADGTLWTNTQLAARTGQAADTIVYGRAGADLLTGRGGDDLLSAGEGDDALDGGAGMDVLDGGAGDDLLRGGQGNDILAGGPGADTYQFERGDGVDDIRDDAAPAAAPNVIRFGAGIKPADLSVSLADKRVRIDYGQGDAIVLDHDVFIARAPVVDRFEFADGASYRFAELFDTAPVLTWPLANHSVSEGQAFGMAIMADTFIDIDGDPLRFEYTMADGSALPAWLSQRADGVLYGTPGYTDSGVFNFKLSATDTSNQSAQGSFTLTVLNQNRAPVVTTPTADVTVQENTYFNVATPRFADPDSGDTVSMTLRMDAGGAPLPAWMQYDAVTGALWGTPGYSDAGTYKLRATAVDQSGLFVRSVFSVTVGDANRAPVLESALPYLEVNEGAWLTRVLPRYIDPDNSNAALTYTTTLADGSPLPSWLVFDGSKRTLSGVADDADTGRYVIRYSASEGAGGPTSSANFELNAININRAAYLKEVPHYQSLEDGLPLSLTFSETMFVDADAGDSGVMSAVGLPAWLAFNPQTRTLSGTPALADVGDQPLVQIVWTDAGGLATSAGLGITVKAAASVSLAGTAGADILTGRSNNDSLDGAAGNDTLDGRQGADSMRGGLGDDIFYVDHAGDTVLESAGEGVDTVLSQLSYVLGADVEHLTLTGSAAVNGTGNALNNTITGNGGANVLDGGAGSDSLAGGGGNDTYLVGSGDTVTETEGAGIDHVITSLGTTLGLHVEALTLTGSSLVNGTGNVLNNLLKGNSSANTLNGLDGIDLLQGGLGDDILGDTAGLGNLFDGGGGADRLSGGAGRELFIGGAGNDTISTGTGADILVFNRGHGADIVNASTGADNVLSLGGGIGYGSLTLRKSGQDLILSTSSTDQITFKSWYAGSKSVGTLQMVIDQGPSYQPGSGNAIADNKVELFDFAALVARFDARGSGWTVAGSLAAVARGGSDTEAIGGDLAYAYAHDGNLGTIGMGTAIAIIGSATFGSGGQLFGGSGLNDGSPLMY